MHTKFKTQQNIFHNRSTMDWFNKRYGHKVSDSYKLYPS